MDGTSSLLELLEIELDKQLNSVVPNEALGNSYLYHYTDFNGLKGIIENQCLFASNSSFLNDEKEYSFGVDIFIKSAESIKSNTKSHIKNALADEFTSLVRQRSISNHYVASFSKKPDLLSQWRAYANNGKGIAIH